MALMGLHTNWLTGSYAGDREYILRSTENNELFRGVNVSVNLRDHFDQNNSIALGYGLDLLVNSDTTINSYLMAAGLATLTSQDATTLAQARAYRSTQLANGQPVSATTMQNFVNQLSLDLLTDATARGLLNVVANDKESQLIHDLTAGGMSASDLNTFSGTREYAALVSLKFNGISPVVRDKDGVYLRNTKMLDAILDGNRAEAWYEIRYNSNGNDLTGLAKRRFFEADTFGLYRAGASSSTIPDAEAKDVFRMYTSHREAIQAYELKYAAQIAAANNDYLLVADQVEAWAQDSQIARQYLIATYSEGRTIDGEVLVGQDAVLPGDRLDGTTLNDLIFGEQGHDILKGEAGGDVILGGAGTDQLTGGVGNDYLDGGAGYDTYIYRINDGQDTIRDADGRGSVFYDGKLVVGGVRSADSTGAYTSLDGTFTFLQSGTDLIVNNLITLKNYMPGQLGIQLTDAPATSTQLPPTFRTISGDFLPLDTDVVEGGVQIGFDDLGNIIQDPASPSDWQDTLNGSGNNDLINGGALRDRLTALGGDDIVIGGSDIDVLIGQEGNDQLFADQLMTVASLTSREHVGGLVGTGAQGDFLTGGLNDDVLVGGAGHDALYGGAGKDLIFGGAGNDVIDGDEDFVATGFGWFYSFSDRFSYTLFNAVKLSDGSLVGDDDEIYGGAGDDVIIGHKGNDLLYGEAGDDEISGSEGDDLVFGGADNDFIQGDDVGHRGNDYLDGGDGDDVVLGADGDDIVVGGAGHDILYGEAASLLGVSGDDVLDGGEGDDELFGTGGNDILVGGAGNDVLLGDFSNDTVPGNDFLYGGDGDDRLAGFAGDDTLDGGDGVDELQGGDGSDLLHGGAGNDQLFGQGNDDTLFGDEGDDAIAGNDGNDFLVGGVDNDILEGGIGDDTLFGGAGADVLAGSAGADIYVFNLGDGIDTIQDTAGEGNRLVFGAGITDQDITLGIGSLLLRVGLNGDAIHIQGFDPANPTVPAGIDRFEFADGTTLTHAELVVRGFDLVGTAGNDSLNGGETYRGIYGLDGDDVLTGGALDNVLDGSGGQDLIFGNGGVDQLSGGSGDDVMRGGTGDDVLTGGTGNDSLEGEAGNDVLNGGIGGDQLLGGEGADTYQFNLGDGIDSISDSMDVAEPNRVLFGPGITSSSLTLTTDFGQVLVRPGLAFEGVTIGADGSDALGFHAVDLFQFEDGTSLTYADLVARGFDLDGTEFDDFLFGTNVVDRFRGGIGNDRLEGGEGGDTYFINLGDGVDTIVDTALADAGNDVVFDAGIASADLRLDLAPDQSDSNLSDLLIRIGLGGDAIQMDTFDRNDVMGPRTVETFRFADGSTLTYEQLLARGFDLTGTDGDDQISGTNVADRIVAGDGADVLRSGAGDDTLEGGLGHDRLIGGQGNDTYEFGPGSGHDTIVEFQGESG